MILPSPTHSETNTQAPRSGSDTAALRLIPQRFSQYLLTSLIVSPSYLHLSFHRLSIIIMSLCLPQFLLPSAPDPTHLSHGAAYKHWAYFFDEPESPHPFMVLGADSRKHVISECGDSFFALLHNLIAEVCGVKRALLSPSPSRSHVSPYIRMNSAKYPRARKWLCVCAVQPSLMAILYPRVLVWPLARRRCAV